MHCYHRQHPPKAREIGGSQIVDRLFSSSRERHLSTARQPLGPVLALTVSTLERFNAYLPAISLWSCNHKLSREDREPILFGHGSSRHSQFGSSTLLHIVYGASDSPLHPRSPKWGACAMRTRDGPWLIVGRPF